MLKKMVKLMGVLFISCLMVGAVGTVAAADDLNLEESLNINPEALTADGDSYSFSMYPGGYYSNYSALDGEYPADCGYPADYDKYTMRVTSACTVTIELVDCCLMGDTICLSKKSGQKKCALSPATVTHTQYVPVGTYTFFVIYTGQTTCVFPAGYDIYVSGS